MNSCGNPRINQFDLILIITSKYKFYFKFDHLSHLISRVSVEEQFNLVQFCSKISDLVENGEDRNGQLWSDVHPVLTYLLSKYFPANIVPASVKNALRAISFRSYKNENMYQVNKSIPSILLLSCLVSYFKMFRCEIKR